MMIQKYTIKGIRKFNEDKVIEWTRKIFKALGNDLEVSEWYNTPTDMYWECITLMAENGSWLRMVHHRVLTSNCK